MKIAKDGDRSLTPLSSPHESRLTGNLSSRLAAREGRARSSTGQAFVFGDSFGRVCQMRKKGSFSGRRYRRRASLSTKDKKYTSADY